MEYLKIDGEVSAPFKSAVTLGKFDGIHRGHQKLVEKILEQKVKRSADSPFFLLASAVR